MENSGIFYCLYKIKNNLNQKFYVGAHATKNLDDNYFGSSEILKKAVKKYGRENFTKEIFMFCDSIIEMYKMENFIVDETFIRQPDTYNVKVGGYGSKGGEMHPSYGTHPTEEQRVKMVNTHKGKTKSQEHRSKIARAHIGLSHTKESKNKMVESKKGTNNPMYGKIHTTESRNKMSVMQNGHIVTEERKEHISIALKEYWRLKKLEKELGSSIVI